MTSNLGRGVLYPLTSGLRKALTPKRKPHQRHQGKRERLRRQRQQARISREEQPQ